MRSRYLTVSARHLGLQCCFDSFVDLIPLQIPWICCSVFLGLFRGCSCHCCLCWNGCGGCNDTRLCANLLHAAIQRCGAVLGRNSTFHPGNPFPDKSQVLGMYGAMLGSARPADIPLHVFAHRIGSQVAPIQCMGSRWLTCA